MKKGIFAFIMFALAAFVFVSCDRAQAKAKDYAVQYASPPAVHQTITITAPVLSFGILPQKVQMPENTIGYPVITIIGHTRDKHGFGGFNYLQCRKS